MKSVTRELFMRLPHHLLHVDLQGLFTQTTFAEWKASYWYLGCLKHIHDVDGKTVKW